MWYFISFPVFTKASILFIDTFVYIIIDKINITLSNESLTLEEGSEERSHKLSGSNLLLCMWES